MAVSDSQGYVSIGEILPRASKPIKWPVKIWISLVETTLNYQVSIAYIFGQSIRNMN